MSQILVSVQTYCKSPVKTRSVCNEVLRLADVSYTVPALFPGLPWLLEDRLRPDEPDTGFCSSFSSPLVRESPLEHPGEPPCDPPTECLLLLLRGADEGRKWKKRRWGGKAGGEDGREETSTFALTLWKEVCMTVVPYSFFDSPCPLPHPSALFWLIIRPIVCPDSGE